MEQNKETKNERKEKAREAARQIREKNNKSAKRKKFWIGAGIVVLSVLVIGAIALAIIAAKNASTETKTMGTSVPANLYNNGIVQTKNGIEKSGSPAIYNVSSKGKISLKSKATGTPADLSSAKNHIILYIDYNCPVCKEFETSYGAYIQNLVKTGQATLEVRPIAFISQWSAQAANAAAAVATYSPQSFPKFTTYMYEHQPDENGPYPSDATLKKYVKKIGVKNYKKIAHAIDTRAYYTWVQSATGISSAKPLPGVEDTTKRVSGTPTVIINGQVITDFTQFSTEYEKLAK